MIVTPRTDSIASWAVEPVSQSLDPTSLVSGFSVHESSGPHAPSTNSTLGLDNGRTYYRRSATEGPAPAFRPLPARSTLVAPDNDHLPRSGRLAFSHARLRASFGLAASPRSRRQDASNSLLQPTFRATSTHDKHHLWRLPIEPCGKPASVRFRDRLLGRGRSWRSRFLGRRRTTLRSSGPPTASRLTTRRRLRADRLPRSRALWAPGGSEAPQLCRLAGAPPNRTL